MCQKLGNGPGLVKCPAPRQCKICKCPTPGTDKTGKCPTVARGGGGGGGVLGAGGIDWCIIEYGKIRNCLSQNEADILVLAFISSKLDFCNALLYGLPWSVLDRLQYVQNFATHLVSRTQSSEHTCITPVLYQLPWLPIKQWIAYKILLLMYNAMNGMAAKYIVDLLDCYNPTRQLRSSSSNPIFITKV